jgi:hypothetical protein
MSDTPAILTRCRLAGLRVWRDGDGLAIAPARRCPPELLAEIRAAKPQLLDWLDAHDIELPADETPWLHISRQVLAGEFDGCDRSTAESLRIGLRALTRRGVRLARIAEERLQHSHRRA